MYRMAAIIVVLALTCSCVAAEAQPEPVKAVQGIVERWFPEHRDDFVFEQIPRDPAGDVFEIESRPGKIVVRGNDGVALASGLNWYLKHTCNVNITYFACQMKLPRVLPAVPSKIRQVSPYKYRYIFNYCAFSYALAWLDWPRWERLIDYMALHGINIPLSVTGQEAVWREVYRKLGLSEQQISEFFTGAAFLPFGWMGCVDGWGGPLPESWYAKRVELQKKIVERERSFGMKPVLQGFTGHVPKGIQTIFPKAKLHKTSWNTFEPTFFLDPLDPNFQKIGAMFIEEQSRMFGTDHLYASDTFIEMKPDNNDPAFLAAFGKAIYEGMSSADPEAIWVLQDWFFAFDEILKHNFWQEAQTKALLTSVPQGRLLVLEMGWFWTTKKAFYGQPWVLTYVHNFGGVVSLHGALDANGPRIFTALHHPDRGSEQGLGTTDEGFDYNPHVIEFMTDSIWRAEQPDMEKWYADYLRRRYGQQDSAIDQAWKILRKTAFSVWRYDSMICNLHGGDKAPGPGYSNKELAGALDLYLQAADRLSDTDTYRFDLLNIERQVLANHADKYFNEIRAAVAAKDAKALDAAGGRMLGLIDDLDRLAATREDYMFGPWLEAAKAWGTTDAEKRYYEWNARNLLTLWGPAQSGCYQYAQRQWAGLLKDYYRIRWAKALQALRDALEAGKPLDEAAFMKGLREWEDEWGHQNTMFATKAEGDTVEVARELWANYRPEVLIASAATSPATTGAAGPAVLAPENGRLTWSILLAEREKAGDFNIDASGWPASDPGYERAAADELASLIERMIGVRPQVVAVKGKSDTASHPRYIAIGKLAVELGAAVPRSKFGVDGSVVEVSADRILLAGETPVASYFAMTRLAEMAGCRWYMPGQLGEIIPRRDKLTFPAGNYPEVPAVWSRSLWLNGGDWADSGFHRWLLHNRQYGVSVPSGHAWGSILPADKYFKDHPDWYMMRGGQRIPFMLCTSNAEMTREFIKNFKTHIKQNPADVWYSISQDDGIAFCECGNCRALDPGLKEVSLPSVPQMTDRLVSFYNQVVTELVKDYPDKYFAFLAYMGSTAPPRREKLHPHLMPVIAPYFYSRYHPIGSRRSETMRALETYIQDWSRCSENLGYYAWAFNLDDLISPYTREAQTRHDIPFLVRNSAGLVCMETVNVWQNLLPYYYLLARLNVDSKADADAIVNEFYRDFFGPAAAEMKAYMDMLDEAYSGQDYEVGGQWIVPLVFTPEFMKKAESLLSASEKKAAGDELLRKRVEMWRFGHENARLFLRIMEAINRCEFQAAADDAEAFVRHQEEMLKRNPYAVSRHSFAYSWKVLWKDHIDLCAGKLKGGRIVYKFPDEWYAFPDYSGIGEVGRLYNPELPTTQWIKLKTYSQTIGQQNLSLFRGTIWYRNNFKLSPQDLGKRLHLLFTGAGNNIVVYVNGKQVGPRTYEAIAVADRDVTDFVHAGDNTVVCSVDNSDQANTGVGGLMHPVVLYSPAGEATASGR